MMRMQWCFVGVTFMVVLSLRNASASIFERSLPAVSSWGVSDPRIHKLSVATVNLLRGGDEDEDSEEADEEEEEEEESDEEEEEDEEEQELKVETNVIEYDAPLELPPTIQMGTMLGLMVLTRRLDMYDPKIVKIGRFIFIAFVIIQQIFCLYVRIQAKVNNDQTPIETKNALSGILNSQLQNQEMIKNLASSFLSTQSTVMEYDVRQAKNLSGGILLNMAFMWFLHFKMGQTQPLFFQSVQGLTNLVFSPLFQCYVLGRNLERPFKVGALAAAAPADTETTEESEEPVTVDTEIVATVEDVDEVGDEDDVQEEEETEDDEQSDDDKTRDEELAVEETAVVNGEEVAEEEDAEDTTTAHDEESEGGVVSQYEEISKDDEEIQNEIVVEEGVVPQENEISEDGGVANEGDENVEEDE